MIKKILIVSGILLAGLTFLAACSPTTSTVTSTSTTTETIAGTTTITSTTVVTSTVTIPTTTSSGTVSFEFPGEGVIRIDGEGYFYFQQISYPIGESINFHGVTFSPGGAGPGDSGYSRSSWIEGKNHRQD